MHNAEANEGPKNDSPDIKGALEDLLYPGR